MRNKKRFGEYLVEKKVITKAQLEEAIDAQVIYGGRIGTNLVEMGYLSINSLTMYLSQYHNLPSPTEDEIKNIKGDVIGMLPKQLAIKHQAIPFSFDGRRLKVVIADPSNLSGIDEIAFSSGSSIITYILPEIMIFMLLERYYGFRRETRYLLLSKAEKKEYGISYKREIQKKPVVGMTDEKGEQGYLTTEDEFKKLYIEKKASVPVRKGEEYWKEETKERDSLHIKVDELFATEEVEAQNEEYEVEILEEEERQPEPVDFKQALHLMSNAKNRDELGEAIIRYCSFFFKRACLFIVNRDRLIGWDGCGEGVKRDKIKRLVMNVESASTLGFVVETGGHYLGRFPEDSANRSFFELIGGMPKSGFIIPIHFKGRVVNLLYGDGGADRDTPRDIGELLIFFNRVPEAYLRLCRERRKT